MSIRNLNLGQLGIEPLHCAKVVIKDMKANAETTLYKVTFLCQELSASEVFTSYTTTEVHTRKKTTADVSIAAKNDLLKIKLKNTEQSN